MSRARAKPLQGTRIVITRPVGEGRTLARHVRALGGQPVLLPGVSLRPIRPVESVRAPLREALAGDVVLFTSPAAVRFAARATRLAGRARIATVGSGTARALHRHGVRDVIVPQATQNSEGLLAHPALAAVNGLRVAVVGAPGGRGTLQRTLRSRGAQLVEVSVYERVAARLDARHRAALARLGRRHGVLLSSAETLRCLQAALTAADWQRLTAGVAIVSSARIGREARVAGFARILEADSALGDALLARAALWARSAAV